MSLVAFGLNHQTAPLSLREQLAFPAEQLKDALGGMLRTRAVSEAAILSTCNRTEIYCNAQDVQATLAAFTVQAAAQHLRRHAPAVRRLLVSGGGVRNTHLMQGLAAALPEVAVASSGQFGIDPQAVEAAAFAWLASKTLRQEPVDWRSVTGAGTAHVPGCLYAAAY